MADADKFISKVIDFILSFNSMYVGSGLCLVVHYMRHLSSKLFTFNYCMFSCRCDICLSPGVVWNSPFESHQWTLDST